MKKTLSLLLALAICLAFAPMARAVEIAGGYCGDPDVNDGKDVKWSLDDAGKFTISGTGKMADYQFENVKTDDIRPWKDYRKQVYTVEFEGSVTYIGEGAFRSFTKLKNIELPKTVTSIGKLAFYGCDSLESITLPDGLKSVGEQAFGHCEVLESIELPTSVEKIGFYAFGYCFKLTEFVVPERVTTIEANTFSYCSGLTTVFIPANVTNIGASAFSNCGALSDVYYDGTESEWNTKIDIGLFNEPLCSATIHFDSPRPVPVSSAVILAFSSSDNGPSATVRVAAGVSATAVYAVYDIDGRLLSVDLAPLTDGQDNILSFAADIEQGANAKLFILGSNYAPLCSCRELPLQ